MPFRSEVFDFHSRNELEDPFSHFPGVRAIPLCPSRLSSRRRSSCARARAYENSVLFALHFLPARGNSALIEIPPKRGLDEFIWVPSGMAGPCAIAAMFRD